MNTAILNQLIKILIFLCQRRRKISKTFLWFFYEKVKLASCHINPNWLELFKIYKCNTNICSGFQGSKITWNGTLLAWTLSSRYRNRFIYLQSMYLSNNLIITCQLPCTGNAAVHDPLTWSQLSFFQSKHLVIGLDNIQQTNNSLIAQPLSGSPNCAW